MPEKLTVLLRSKADSGKAGHLLQLTGACPRQLPSGTVGLDCRNAQLHPSRSWKRARGGDPELIPQSPSPYPVPFHHERAASQASGQQTWRQPGLKAHLLSSSNDIIGSALGYGFLPADRVCVPMGLTFN